MLFTPIRCFLLYINFQTILIFFSFAMVFFTSAKALIVVFCNLYSLVTQEINVRSCISKLSSFLFLVVVIAHVSDAYITIDSLQARYDRTLTLIHIFVFEKLVFLSRPNALIDSPRKINLFTFSIGSPPKLTF